MLQTRWSNVIRGFLGGVFYPQGIGLTDDGKCRSRDEDAIFVSDSLRLYLVADGMGGHAHGEIASALAIEAISGRFTSLNGMKPSLC